MKPLAARLRPSQLDHYAGQKHLLGPGRPLRKLIDSGHMTTSLLLWGPPGCGKTTLAYLIAQHLGLTVEILSAVESGVKDLRAVAEQARQRADGTLLFIDEIHRFSKTQQDALLPHVESGLLQLIGASTESPYGSVIPALLSRCQVYRLHPLEDDELVALLERALEQELAKMHPELEDGLLAHLAERAGGDARWALGLLEQAILSAPLNSQGCPRITRDWVDAHLSEAPIRHHHVDCTSALIKSIRGSDTQASLYWLGRMVAGGEPVDYLTRRLRILASEDVGLADPQAILHTQACCAAAEAVGYPEARYALAQATVYLSLAPKSDSLGGFFKAEERARSSADAAVPEWLRPGGKYHNPHQETLHFRSVSHMPKGMEKERFYQPGDLGYEIKLRQRIDQLWPPS